MKKVHFVLFLSISIRCAFAGCTGPRLYTSIGFNPSYYSKSETIYVLPGDSFSIKIDGGTCGGLTASLITFNGYTIYKNVPLLKLPCSLGEYKITAENNRFGYTSWSITFATRPIIVLDTNSQSQITAILPIKILNPDFLLYPNPAVSKITIENESDELKGVQVYNTNGTLMYEHRDLTAKLTIPLKDYPEGVYVLRVATLAGKLIIRKLIVR